jgi:hypothetical protein
VSTERARRAERQAEDTRIAANQARSQAELLLGYLTDDFSRELGSFGRVDLVGQLAKRQLDYFKALPQALKDDPDTSRNGAIAMVQYAKAMRQLGNTTEAERASGDGVQLLQKLQQHGDKSERTGIALAMGNLVQEMVLNNQQSPEALPKAQRAADILKPIADAPGASLNARRAYIEILGRLGWEQLRALRTADGLATLQLQMREAAALGARDLKYIDVAAAYAESGGWQIEALGTLGRGAEARRVGADAGAVAAKVLELRPGYLMALRAQHLIAANLAYFAMDDMHAADAIELFAQSETASRSLVKLDPNNTILIANLGVALRGHADAIWAAGRPREAIAEFVSANDVYKKTESAGASFVSALLNARISLAQRQADVGDAQGLRATLAESAKSIEALRHSAPAGSSVVIFGNCLFAGIHAAVALVNADPATTRRLGKECLDRATPLVPHGPTEEFYRNATIFYTGDTVGQAEFMLRDYSGAERTLRESLDARHQWPLSTNGDRRDEAEVSTYLALALARQERLADAKKVIDPVVKLQRGLAARNHDDQWQKVELAAALFAQALVDKAHHAALLNEAAALLARLPQEMGKLQSIRRWRDRIGQEQHGHMSAIVPATARRYAG